MNIDRIAHIEFLIYSYCIFILLLPGLLVAQPTQLGGIDYTERDGLPSTEVYKVFQDRQGYIWVGTDSGVSRFNGHVFENFGFAEGLAHNFAYDFRQDASGQIWIATLPGNLYYFSDGKMHPYQYNHLLESYGNQRWTVDFFFDEEGTLHIGMLNKGVVKIYADGRHELIHPKDRCRVQMIYKKGENYILVSFLSKADCSNYTDKSFRLKNIDLLFYEDGSFQNLSTVSSHERISYMVALSKNELLLAANTHLYYLKNRQLEQVVKFDHSIIALEQLSDQRICIGFKKVENSGGLQIYESLPDLLAKKGSTCFKHLSISSVLEDWEGGLWLGSIENGIRHVPDRSMKIWNQQSGLSDNFVSALSIGKKGNILVGLKNGHLYQLQRKSQQLRLLHKIKYEIHDVFFDKDYGRIWVGGYDLLSILKEKQWAKGGGIKKFSLSNGVLWGCLNGPLGFGQLDRSNGLFLSLPEGDANLGNRAFAIYEDFQARVWVGQDNGLFEYVDDSLRRPTVCYPALKSRVEEIAQLADSILVVGTKLHGVLLLKNGEHTQIDQSAGLSSNMVKKIHIDDKGYIWVGTSRGLNRICLMPGGDFSIKKYRMGSGLPSDEITDIISDEEYIWVSTKKGLACLTKEDIVPRHKCKPILQYVKVNNKLWKEGDATSLSHKQSNIQFDYFTIDFSQNRNIEYRYRLLPDSSWTHTQHTSATYPALAAGAYTFELESSDRYGQWSEKTTFNFRIVPPLWETFSFWASCFSLLAVLLSLYFKSRIRRLERKAKIEGQVRELQQVALRSQMTPHFIFNCLNTIQGYIAEQNTKVAAHYVRHFSRLTRSILHFSTKKVISLEEEVGLLRDYLELEKGRLNEPLDYTIEIAPDVDVFEDVIPPMLLQPLAENAIVHGLVGLNRKGRIAIICSKAGKDLIVCVRDNGVGLGHRKQSRGRSYPSVGLDIIRKRLTLYQQGQITGVFFSIRDLKGEPGWQSGTEVELRIRQDIQTDD
ncbi:MAG: two-component regulator propeller domain-containing protein [Bacteroidota bacterium]